MEIIWGVVIVALSGLAWGGQTIAWFAPETAVRLGLMEARDDVEPAYWADIRGEAAWDVFTLWTMLAAGILLIAAEPAWAYFGLVGGGVYVYFAGRGIFSRVTMQRKGLRIGTPKNLRLGYSLLTIWGVMGLVVIIAAVAALTTS